MATKTMTKEEKNQLMKLGAITAVVLFGAYYFMVRKAKA
jgi:hypothetical protein